MANSTINPEVTVSQWNTITKQIYYRISGRTVHILMNGSVSLDSDGYLLKDNNYYTLPQDIRPLYPIYFFATPSGNATIAPYLGVISADGKIRFYTRGDSIDYLFGNVCYSID